MAQLESIESVIGELDFIIQEKYKIASSIPGSGNTKNIGSIKIIRDIKSGNGPFALLGEEIFDDYWMYYQTREMSRNVSPDGKPPYKNLKEYVKYKRTGSNIGTEYTNAEKEGDQ